MIETESPQLGQKNEILPTTSQENAEELKPRCKKDYGRRYKTQPISVPLSKIFIEVEDGFKQVSEDHNKSKPQNEIRNSNQPQPSKENVFNSLAKRSHIFFHRTCTLSFGLLAGVALCHNIFIFHITPQFNSWTGFLNQYNKLANTWQSIFYFLIVICSVSILDRIDIANQGLARLFILYKTRKPVLLAILLYPMSLLLTISITDTDNLIDYQQYSNKSTWHKTMLNLGIDVERKLDLWRWLTLVRSICVILGWIIVGIRTEKDIFLESLNLNY